MTYDSLVNSPHLRVTVIEAKERYGNTNEGESEAKGVAQKLTDERGSDRVVGHVTELVSAPATVQKLAFVTKGNQYICSIEYEASSCQWVRIGLAKVGLYKGDS